MCGVAIATAALVCVLSGFNGFQDMVASLFTQFDPQLKVMPVEGKYMAADEPELEKLKAADGIATYCEVVEDNAMLMVNNRQAMVTIKGVDDNFEQLIDVDKIKYGDGAFQLHVDVLDYGVLGINLLSQLGLSADFSETLEVYAPSKGERIDLNDPESSFNHEELYSPKMGFCVKQNKYDGHYVVTSIGFARRLFERQGYVTAVELKMKKGVDVAEAKKKYKALIGDKYRILDRYEQQEDIFKIQEIEKLIAYVFLVFILMVACFNIIGSLSMLMIEKKNDILTMRNLGASDNQVAGVFMCEGGLISAIGAVLGIGIGLGMCFLQQKYELVRFGNSAGNFIIDAYPVSVHPIDILVVFATVLVVASLSVWIAVKGSSLITRE